jgi:GNAT superfamily N-acetyltransferase
MQGFYLIGDHTDEDFVRNLDSYIKRIVEPRMREVSLSHFEVSGHHDEWSMESIFPTRSLYKFEQLVFSLVKEPRVQRNKKFEIINLKTDAWENRGIKNIKLIHRHLGLFWSSQGDFKEKGFGFAAVDKDEILGVCYSSFVTHDTHAIGVETMPQFQNNGVGSHLTSLLVEEIVNHGFIPYWDCSLDNESSKKLAERLGFDLIHRYTCYSFGL